MAEGYAKARPALHPRIIELAAGSRKFGRILDVGCGAGLSTAPLTASAGQVLGIEPVEAMLGPAQTAVPHARFVAASGEAIPFRSGSIDAITAAGSLNYLNIGRFFGEAARLLAPDGEILVYDFSTGRSFRDSDQLDAWFVEFERRYPWPRNEATALDPEILARLDSQFQVTDHARFEIGMDLDASFYTGYVMTETNVAQAIRSGSEPESIRQWCAETLGPLFGETPREVLFRGYFAWMSRR